MGETAESIGRGEDASRWSRVARARIARSIRLLQSASQQLSEGLLRGAEPSSARQQVIEAATCIVLDAADRLDANVFGAMVEITMREADGGGEGNAAREQDAQRPTPPPLL